MAKATKGTRTIKRVKKIQVPSITLELSEGEADFLQALLCKASGDEINSPRKYAVAITKALKFATGQEFDETDAFKLMASPRVSTVRFRNYPPKDMEGGTHVSSIPATMYGVYDSNPNPRH